MLKPYIAKVLERCDLSAADMGEAMGHVMDGAATPAQIGAFLVALRMKGETVDEVVGAARAMRARMIAVPCEAPDALVDTCGTGGDGAGTFNISTAAALVAAAAGARVAKHGNRSVSSSCGSADVLRALGVDTEAELGPERLAALLREVGICFLMAPRHHPAMKHAIGPRRELGLRTIFNLLGPMTNPAGARRQVMGVFADRWRAPAAAALGGLGAVRAWVVHSEDGLDELSLCAPTRVSEWREGRAAERVVTPEDAGLRRAAPGALEGGDPARNAELMEALLDGAEGVLADAVALNAGAALVVAELAPDLRRGVAMAREALRSGAARERLDALRAATRAA